MGGGCPTAGRTGNRSTETDEGGAQARSIREIRIEFRRDPRRPREMGGAAAQLAHVAVLAAALGSEADRDRLLCTVGDARTEWLIAFELSLRRSSRLFPPARTTSAHQ